MAFLIQWRVTKNKKTYYFIQTDSTNLEMYLILEIIQSGIIFTVILYYELCQDFNCIDVILMHKVTKIKNIPCLHKTIVVSNQHKCYFRATSVRYGCSTTTPNRGRRTNVATTAASTRVQDLKATSVSVAMASLSRKT